LIDCEEQQHHECDAHPVALAHGQRAEDDIAAPPLCANSPYGLKPVYDRQADIHEDDRRAKSLCELHRLKRTVSDTHLMPIEFQQQRQ
jgi:hypothetical protein